MSELATDPALRARALVRAADHAALGALLPSGGGDAVEPYVSLVEVSAAPDGSPLMLLSDLAEHTRALRLNAAASLLIDGTQSSVVRLAGARVALQGRVRPIDDRELLHRHVALRPAAETYAGFADFRLYRLEIARARAIAGFGAIAWIDGAALREPALERLMAHQERAAEAWGERAGWALLWADWLGVDLARAAERRRVAFEEPASDEDALLRALCALAID